MSFKNKIIPFLFGLMTVALIITSAALVKTQDVYAAKNEKYKNLDTFTRAMHLIENSYVEEVENKTMVYGAIKGMLNELDPHSTFLDPETLEEFRADTQGEFGGLGITIGMRDKILTVIAPLEDTPAFKKGILAGDQIIKIEGESTMGLTLHDAVKKLRGEAGTDVNITIHRDSLEKPLDVKITRAIIKIKSVKYSRIDDIGYIRLVQFSNNISNQMIDAVKILNKEGAKRYIIDVRNNPGGLLTEAIKVSSVFLPARLSVVYTMDRIKNKQDYNSTLLTHKELTKPLVILTNGGSASASEILTGALQDHERALIMGEKTYGKASVQSVIPLTDGSAIKLTTAKYFTPNGREIHNIGIEPNIEVKYEEKKLSEDEKKAIEKKVASNSARIELNLERDNQLAAGFSKNY